MNYLFFLFFLDLKFVPNTLIYQTELGWVGKWLPSSQVFTKHSTGENWVSDLQVFINLLRETVSTSKYIFKKNRVQRVRDICNVRYSIIKLVLHHRTSQGIGYQSEQQQKKYDGHGRASKKKVGKRDRGPCLTPAHSLLGYLLTEQRAGVALQLQHVAMGTRSIQPGWGGRFIWKENEWECDWTKTCLDEAGPIGIKVTASIPQVPLLAMFHSRHSPSTLTPIPQRQVILLPVLLATLA